MTMAPGPAFIPLEKQWSMAPFDLLPELVTLINGVPEIFTLRRLHNVPDGYIWQPATISTGAGWVRPNGGNLL